MRKIFYLLIFSIFLEGKSQLILLMGSGSKLLEASKREAFETSPDKMVPLGPKAHSLYLESQHGTKKTKSSSGGLWIQYEKQEIKYPEENSKYFLKRNDFQNREVNKTIRKLDKLRKRSSYAKNIIQTLQTSTNKFVIKISSCEMSYLVLPIRRGKSGILNNNAYAFQIMETDSLIVDYAPFDKIGSSAEIRWNNSNGLMCLAHELAHAYDANYGLLDNRIIIVNGKAIVAREIRAIYHENIIRKELGKPLRTTINEVKTWIVDGKPITYVLPWDARK